jgi:gliding motility-associated-like protein
MTMQLKNIFLLTVLVFSGATVFAQITSTFTSNAEGWTTPNDADGTIAYSATGGNPGGFVFGTPFVFNLAAGSLYVPFNFVAPGTYLGNRSSYYNGTLRYDIQQSTTGTPNQYPEVTIADNLGITLYYFPATPNQPAAAPSWTTFSVTLNNALGFWKTTNSATGVAASEAQLLSVLTNLASLQIRGLYRDANTTNRLDNVTFNPPIVITTQPVSRVICEGVTTSLATAATGNANITYQWEKQGPAPTFTWSNVANGGGYSGATTASLTVNTTGNIGAGVYRCKVSGTAVNDAFTALATITVNASPTPPATTGNTSCAGANLTLSATGGTAGQYRWYTVASGGTAIAGQINSSYTTPILFATTTYYVSINNGTCESARTAVIAAIITPPAKPIITSSEPITGGVATLCLNPVILTAPVGFPSYTWSNGQTTQQITTIEPGKYSVVVKEASGCVSVAADTVQVVNSTSPLCINNPPAINSASAITTIGGSVSIDLAPLLSDPDNNLNFTSLLIVGNGTSKGGTTSLDGLTLEINYNDLKFAGEDNVTIRICDLLNVCSEQVLTIEVIGDINVFNGISPNGDDKNDKWIIEYIDLFPDTQKNRVTIYNRWGDVVWEASDYDNSSVVFIGHNKNGNELSTGSYFYKIEFTGGRDAITGYLSLKR